MAEIPASKPEQQGLKEGLFYLFLAMFAAGLPLLIVGAGWPPFRKTAASPLYIPYELFGFSAAAAVLLLAWRDWTRARGRGRAAGLGVLLPLMVGLFYAGYLAEHTSKAFDYVCYEAAVNNLIASGNPYADPKFHFLYPPAFAQAFALLYKATYSLPVSAQIMGGLPFYLYQCGQFFMVLIVHRLLAAAGRAIGLGAANALALATALVLVNNPLIRTLHHNQVNLYVLGAMLGGLLLAERKPVAAGTLLAIAIHIKVYPVVLLGALVPARRWKAAAATVAAVAIIAVAGAGCQELILKRTDRNDRTPSGFFRTYSYYRESMKIIPEFNVFRDNSIRNLVHCALGIGQAPGPDGELPRSPLEKPVTLALDAAALAWIAARLWRRQKNAECGMRNLELKMWGHAGDLLALGLLVSPLAWEHHYLFALPLILWAVGVSGAKRPAALVAAIVLCVGVPTFDLFPFSFHRIAGLVLLLALTPGSRLLELRSR